MRNILRTLLMLAMLPAANLPDDANAQSARTAFKDGYADVNGVRLRYASIGTGPLVLFLHGYPSFWYQWKDQMAEMGRDHLAIGLDMRGYNLSSKPEGLESYTMKNLVEDMRQFAEKIGGKDNKFVLVAHDWGAIVGWVFAMHHPEMLEKLIIINGGHPVATEREFRENAAQRYASNYSFVINGYLAPGEQPINEHNTRDSAERRARTGFVDAEVKSGRYTEDDRQAWIEAWSQPGSTTAGLNYYRANHSIHRSTIFIPLRRFPVPFRRMKSRRGRSR
jgi:pimeloyl-ACP methyl ester carboxylesterase